MWKEKTFALKGTNDQRVRLSPDVFRDVILAVIAVSLAEQITVRRGYDRRGRLQKSVVELVVEKSDIAHLQDWKGFICNGYERAARQRRLAHAATRWRKGEFIQAITTNSDRIAPLHSNEAKMNFNSSSGNYSKLTLKHKVLSLI